MPTLNHTRLITVFLITLVLNIDRGQSASGQTNTPPMPLPGVRSITLPVPDGYTPSVFVTNGWATISFVPILVPPKIERIELAGTNALAVYWSAVPSGAIKFQLQHRVVTVAPGDGWEDVATVETNEVTRTDTDIPVHGNVNYRIRAVGSSAKGLWSEVSTRIRP